MYYFRRADRVGSQPPKNEMSDIMSENDPIIRIEGLHKTYQAKDGARSILTAAISRSSPSASSTPRGSPWE